MRKLSSFGARPASGFTLIELMTVVLVVTILTVIAVPSYLSQTRKSHRTEAKSILLDLAAREERYMATNGSYSQALSDLGLSGSGWPLAVGSNYYQIEQPTVVAGTVSSVTAAATPPAFLIIADAINGQTGDTNCAKMSINQAGQQTSLNSAGAASSGCW